MGVSEEGRGGGGDGGGSGGVRVGREGVLLGAVSYAIGLRKFLWKRLYSSHLDERVLLRPHPFSTGPVVVHTRLAVFGREYSVSLAKLYLVLLLEVGELPSHKRVVKRVCVSCDEGTTPIHLEGGGARGERGSCDHPSTVTTHTSTQCLQVTHGVRREIFQPVGGVTKPRSCDITYILSLVTHMVT